MNRGEHNMIEPFFEFDGVRSDSLGLQIVRIQGGLFELPFMSGKDIKEDQVSRVLSPYFYRTTYKPLEFTLTFSAVDNDMMDSEFLYKISSWLCTNTYRPFVSSENPSRMIYCMGINQINYMTAGTDNGYFEITFRARDPYFLTFPQIETFDLSDNTTYTNIQVTNYSNIGQDYYYPEVEIELLDNATGIAIYNLNDGNRQFGFTNLELLETIYVDNNKRTIISSTNEARFDKLTNKLWFRLVRGVNNLKVVGKCNLQFRCQFPIFN